MIHLVLIGSKDLLHVRKASTETILVHKTGKSRVKGRVTEWKVTSCFLKSRYTRIKW